MTEFHYLFFDDLLFLRCNKNDLITNTFVLSFLNLTLDTFAEIASFELQS